MPAHAASPSSGFHVSNLNPHVDEDVLRQGFENTLGLDPNEIERVTVIRQKVVSTSADMLQTFQQRIRRQIEEYVKEGNYELDLRNPKEADFTYLAFVTLNDIEASISFENLTNPKHRDGRLHHCNLERKEKILALRKPIP
jgi:hypothetical protein